MDIPNSGIPINPRLRSALLYLDMNVTCKRNDEKAVENSVSICYDIFNIDKEEAEHIGTIMLANKSDTHWKLDDPEGPPFGDFTQCIAELKIRAVVNEK